MKLLFLLLTISGNAEPGIIPQGYLLPLMHWCAETGIPVYILANMAEYETGWDEKAVSSKGAEGSVQLMRKYHREFAIRFNGGKDFDPFDPSDNLMIGARYVKWLWNRYGTLRKALYYFACGYPWPVNKRVLKLVNMELGG